MASRRKFLAGLLAASACPVPSWADAGNPTFLSAARKPDGSFALYGLSTQGQLIFEIPLPGRGHAAAANPKQPYVVAFARRPGTFALVINCVTGQIERRIEAPNGRHFYGHGTFSDDGSLLFTTENDFEAAEGRIGVWDARRGYQRVNEFSSGGVGPHDLKLMPNGRSLVVANGGIETHPDSGRTKLNIPTMQSNLSYLSLAGEPLEVADLPSSLRLASIRHLAVRRDGLVAMGCQWQGNPSSVPLVFTHQRGSNIRQIHAEQASYDLQSYIGSIAFSGDDERIIATSPRANLAISYDLTLNTAKAFEYHDVCGVAPTVDGVALTTGQGHFIRQTPMHMHHLADQPLAWDNHLIAI